MVRSLSIAALTITIANATSGQRPAPFSYSSPLQTEPQALTVNKAGSLSAQKVEPSVSGQTNGPSVTPLTRDEAIQLALAQASAFQAAKLNESIAIADTHLAKTAFLPRFSSSSALIYNSPSSSPTSPGLPRSQSFLSADAITVYRGLITVSGDIDTSGRLRAVLKRSRALLEAAHAGSEAARRTLILETDLAYYGLALASAHHQRTKTSLAGDRGHSSCNVWLLFALHQIGFRISSIDR
jgi:outer membrane protein TolC